MAIRPGLDVNTSLRTDMIEGNPKLQGNYTKDGKFH